METVDLTDDSIIKSNFERIQHRSWAPKRKPKARQNSTHFMGNSASALDTKTVNGQQGAPVPVVDRSSNIDLAALEADLKQYDLSSLKRRLFKGDAGVTERTPSTSKKVYGTSDRLTGNGIATRADREIEIVGTSSSDEHDDSSDMSGSEASHGHEASERKSQPLLPPPKANGHALDVDNRRKASLAASSVNKKRDTPTKAIIGEKLHSSNGPIFAQKTRIPDERGERAAPALSPQKRKHLDNSAPADGSSAKRLKHSKPQSPNTPLSKSKKRTAHLLDSAADGWGGSPSSIEKSTHRPSKNAPTLPDLLKRSKSEKAALSAKVRGVASPTSTNQSKMLSKSGTSSIQDQGSKERQSLDRQLARDSGQGEHGKHKTPLSPYGMLESRKKSAAAPEVHFVKPAPAPLKTKIPESSPISTVKHKKQSNGDSDKGSSRPIAVLNGKSQNGNLTNGTESTPLPDSLATSPYLNRERGGSPKPHVSAAKASCDEKRPVRTLHDLLKRRKQKLREKGYLAASPTSSISPHDQSRRDGLAGATLSDLTKATISSTKTVSAVSLIKSHTIMAQDALQPGSMLENPDEKVVEPPMSNLQGSSTDHGKDTQASAAILSTDIPESRLEEDPPIEHQQQAGAEEGDEQSLHVMADPGSAVPDEVGDTTKNESSACPEGDDDLETAATAAAEITSPTEGSHSSVQDQFAETVNEADDAIEIDQTQDAIMALVEALKRHRRVGTTNKDDPVEAQDVGTGPMVPMSTGDNVPSLAPSSCPLVVPEIPIGSEAQFEAVQTTAADDSDTTTMAGQLIVLGKLLREFHEDQHYNSKILLLQARSFRAHLEEPKDTRFTSINGMAGIKHETSPFRDMTPIHEITTGKRDPLLAHMSTESFHPSATRVKGARSQLSVAPKTWKDDKEEVPSYTHYVSLAQNMLAPNQRQLHVLPYFGESVEANVYDTLENCYDCTVASRDETLFRGDRARLYAPYAEQFLEDIGISMADLMYYLLIDEEDVKDEICYEGRERYCEEDFDRSTTRWEAVFSSLPVPATENIKKASLACAAFMNLAGFSLWHIARKSELSRLPRKEKDPQEDPIDMLNALTCRVCHIHDCPYHGEFREYEDTDDESVASIASEDRIDIDWPPEINFKKHVSIPRISDTAEQRNGGDADDKDTSKGKVTYQQLLRHWHTLSHDEPPPFYPCYHPGMSCSKAECSCFRDNAFCEKSCGCSLQCQRRFQGCNCSSHKANSRKATLWVCHQDERCDCFRLKRECDPDLCGTCGSDLVLDGENRYLEEVHRDHCHNVLLQLGIPKRTLLGRSKVHGFGLYAGEAIRKNDYVGEYRGEVTNNAERDRRGEVYEIQRLSYLFKLTTEQDVDSTLAGNKMRFINHASKDSACNIGVAVMLCNTVYRIGMYAKRDIKTGEELYFNYGKLYHEQLLTNSVDTGEEDSIPKEGNAAQSKGTAIVKTKAMVKSTTYDGSHVRNQSLVEGFIEPGGASSTPSEAGGEKGVAGPNRAKGKRKKQPVAEDLRREAVLKQDSRATKTGRSATVRPLSAGGAGGGGGGGGGRDSNGDHAMLDTDVDDVDASAQVAEEIVSEFELEDSDDDVVKPVRKKRRKAAAARRPPAGRRGAVVQMDSDED